MYDKTFNSDEEFINELEKPEFGLLVAFFAIMVIAVVFETFAGR